jgi:hypothetical protein
MANTSQSFVPAVKNTLEPWEVSHHIRLLYQAFGNTKTAIQNIKTGTTTTNVTNLNNTTSGGGGGGVMVGGVNNQTGVTTYTTQSTDNGVVLILDDASPVAVSLNSGVTSPFFIFATNLGAGLVTFTPTSGTINAGATFTLPLNFTSVVAFDGTNWFATGIPIVPTTFTPVAHEFLTGYNSTTGLFSAAQPAFTDISGQITSAQMPAGGLTHVIPLGPLTILGTPGSITVVDGQIMSAVDPT